MHTAAYLSHLQIFQLIKDSVEDINPVHNYGSTSLLFAATNGHLKVCELIMEGLDDKNPGDNYGWTPLHSAAKKGNCEFIMEISRD